MKQLPDPKEALRVFFSETRGAELTPEQRVQGLSLISDVFVQATNPECASIREAIAAPLPKVSKEEAMSVLLEFFRKKGNRNMNSMEVYGVRQMLASYYGFKQVQSTPSNTLSLRQINTASTNSPMRPISRAPIMDSRLFHQQIHNTPLRRMMTEQELAQETARRFVLLHSPALAENAPDSSE